LVLAGSEHDESGLILISAGQILFGKKRNRLSENSANDKPDVKFSSLRASVCVLSFIRWIFDGNGRIESRNRRLKRHSASVISKEIDWVMTAELSGALSSTDTRREIRFR
jgi:hypothetical protein